MPSYSSGIVSDTADSASALSETLGYAAVSQTPLIHDPFFNISTNLKANLKKIGYVCSTVHMGSIHKKPVAENLMLLSRRKSRATAFFSGNLVLLSF
jgi:hypothetical protein